MDKDKNIHQETVTLDGEKGGGEEEGGSPKLIVESNLVTYSTFFHRRKETKNLDHWKKRRYEWSSCVSFTILSY